VNSDVRTLLAHARREGCVVEQLAGGHLRVRKGDVAVVLPATPSDWRSIRNARAQLRRSGLLPR
jgi:hypothetical protein